LFDFKQNVINTADTSNTCSEMTLHLWFIRTFYETVTFNGYFVVNTKVVYFVESTVAIICGE